MRRASRFAADCNGRQDVLSWRLGDRSVDQKEQKDQEDDVDELEDPVALSARGFRPDEHHLTTVTSVSLDCLIASSTVTRF